MSNETPKIYVACLSAYNNGILHGKWIDVVQDVDAVWKDINQMLASSPMDDAEEWAIHDYSGFEEVRIHEYESIDDVVALAQFIHEHGKLGAEVLAQYNNHIEDATHALEECYQGEFESEEDFAQSLFEDCYTIPDYLQNYIDYQKVARDLFINDYMSFEVDHKTHVFSYY
jgi:antirestriction protein